MTFNEKIRNYATPGNLFPELSNAEKKTDYILADIATKIRNKRKELNMTQKEFAEYLNVTQGMISKYEGAEYNFSIESLVTLFDKLNIVVNIKEKNSKSNIYSYKNNYNAWSLVRTNKKDIPKKELGVSA